MSTPANTAEAKEPDTATDQGVSSSSILLAAIVSKFEEMSMFCDVLEAMAVEETRWHDAATLKSQKIVWRRAASMVEEVAANSDSPNKP